MPTSYRRFVALGDSQTEGTGDWDDDGNAVGWADRLATHLDGTSSPGLAYANLAVNGCRAAHVRREQLPVALDLAPDLASVVVGMNDVLRHDYDEDSVVADVEAVVAALRGAGCDVVTMTFPDVGRMLPVMAWLRPRERRLNARLVEVARAYDVPVLDLFPLAMCGDPVIWSHDRIHGSSEGHRRIADGMASLLGLPGSDPTWADPPGTRVDPLRAVARDAWWVATFVAPFLYRQLRGRGPTAGHAAKRPALQTVG
ncbi:lysophospholipase [Marmoricola endophyticus]|uniref:Lysophospholipase n=1 Tax=Marmoricola endophyticus TaxID=2040280 RepID=A0A917F293_9ACTN|nr:SGNH/GDSL hydrolase family protein [Marmoricola endophyticus]GGF45809.1 lysophospholipase [Marmoricola endophyticus]